MTRTTTSGRYLRDAAKALAKAAERIDRDHSETTSRILGGGTILDLETRLAAIEKNLDLAMDPDPQSITTVERIATARVLVRQIRDEIKGGA